jgi:hypothetical protein
MARIDRPPRIRWLFCGVAIETALLLVVAIWTTANGTSLPFVAWLVLGCLQSQALHLSAGIRSDSGELSKAFGSIAKRCRRRGSNT